MTQFAVELRDVVKRFPNPGGGEVIAVNQVTMQINNGEFFSLLGPSGCGKTTSLRMIAGFEWPTSGEVIIDGQAMGHTPPFLRPVNTVFQSYALFQHMTVEQNVAFGLEMEHASKSEINRRVGEALEMVQLGGLGKRSPRQLSGGQQQRVALARALALEPDVLLLDEPLGALDAKIRTELRRSLKAIQRQLGVAAILVTHDQEEAFDLADWIGVMSYGRLVEVGTPRDLYMHPQTEFVASFLGTANILLGQSEGERIRIGPHVFGLTKEATQFSTDGRVQVLFRPEDLALANSQEDLDCTPIGEGVVTNLGFNGPSERIRLELPSISGVRAIAPAVPFGGQNIMIEASRPPEQAAAFPLTVNDKAWVGIRRLHALSHPGLSFLVVTDGSLRSQSAINLGGYLAKMSHARMTLLGVGKYE